MFSLFTHHSVFLFTRPALDWDVIQLRCCATLWYLRPKHKMSQNLPEQNKNTSYQFHARQMFENFQWKVGSARLDWASGEWCENFFFSSLKLKISLILSKTRNMFSAWRHRNYWNPVSDLYSCDIILRVCRFRWESHFLYEIRSRLFRIFVIFLFILILSSKNQLKTS